MEDWNREKIMKSSEIGEKDAFFRWLLILENSPFSNVNGTVNDNYIDGTYFWLLL